MAVRVIRASAVLAIALALGSCSVLNFIFGSVFPSTVALLQSRADLSAKIVSTDGSSYLLRVVEATGGSYVVLTPRGATALPVYVMDLNLNLKKTLPAQVDPGVGVEGFSGDIVIGNQVLNPTNLSVVTTLTTPYQIDQDTGPDGFFSPTAPGFDVTNVNIAFGTCTLNFDNIDATFTFAGSTAPAGVSLSKNLTNMMISAVLEDDSKTADPVILAVNSESGAIDATTYFVSIHRDFFQVANASSAANLLDSAPHRDSLLHNTFGYSKGKIIAWDTSSQSFVSMNPTTAAITGSFYAPAAKQDMQNLRFAYRASGGSFYSFDPYTRVVTEYAAWW